MERSLLELSIVALLVSATTACLDDSIDPRIDAITPDTVAAGTSTSVELEGYFGAKTFVSFHDEKKSRVDTQFSVSLGPHTLAGVRWIDAGHIEAEVANSLPTGTYDVIVRDPNDRIARLQAGFTVEPPCVDADGDGTCAENDCDDDPTRCGAACAPDLVEAQSAATCDDGWDNDCDGTTDGADAGCGCTVDTWATISDGPLEFVPSADLIDGPPTGVTFARGDWSGSASRGRVSGFSIAGRTEPIGHVEAVLVYYVSGALTDDVVRVQVLSGGVAQGSAAVVESARLNRRIGADNVMLDGVDITAARNWTWADVSAGLAIEIEHVTLDTDDRVEIFYDAVGIRMTYACNSEPTAAFTVAPFGGVTATIFSVDASASTDVETTTAGLLVRWDWQSDANWDTVRTTTKTANHTFAAPNLYTVTLEVVDADGGFDFSTRTVAVSDTANLIVVDTSIDEDTDPGTGTSLREAIDEANAQGGVQLIAFAGAMLIQLDGGLGPLPAIDSDLTLIGDGNVTIDGGNLTGTNDDCLQITNDRVTVVGLEIRNCPQDGIQISGPGSPEVIIRDCTIHDVGRDGVLVLDQQGQVIGPGNEVYRAGLHGISIYGGSSDSFVIRGNQIHDNGEHGISLGDDANAGPDNGLIELNRIWNNGRAGIRAVANSRDHVVRHNTLAGNAWSGLYMATNSSDGFEVLNNIFVGSVDFYGINPNGSLFNRLDSNLFFGNLQGPCNACPTQQNAIYLPPLFASGVAGTFTLSDASPAVDAGITVGLDVNGPAPGQFDGTAPDLGATESR